MQFILHFASISLYVAMFVCERERVQNMPINKHSGNKSSAVELCQPFRLDLFILLR